ncbi:amino acid adenylation domain-containing protein [Cystobacter fuscus]|uniref:amino acid adenylation domain-containing protein n=1 Tax=Cystobacter fuscus TaxID=43 RepID=UPI002B31072A|nr:amino acid adenylation domain-containing protein [Cystobacter fuscus]
MNTAPRQIPLSVGQEAMWIGWKLDPSQWSHIIPTPFLVRGTLDMTRLRAAIAALGEAYPQLRARITSGADGLVLDWSDAPPIEVRESTFVGDRDVAIRRAWQHPFDLRRGPLARIDVLRGPDETVLLLAIHHLVFDGASILILLDALRRAYAGESLSPADPTVALTEYARRSRELADTTAGDPSREYWRRVLGATAPEFSLPATVDAPQYTVRSETLEPRLVADLRGRAEELGVSYVTVLMAGYFALLRQHTGAEDVLSFLPFHGRTTESLRDRIGYFVNALPIRAEVRGSDSYADLVHRLRGRVKDAMRHGELPLPAIMRAAGLTGPAARARTHQTVFQYWNAGLRDGVDVQALRLCAPDATATLSLLDMESTAGFTLAVMVREDSTGTHVLWKDPTGAVGPTRVAAMAADYREILRELSTNPNAALPVLAAPSPTAPSATPATQARPAAAYPADVAEMVGVWQEVLGVGGITPEDSFFELGGHSLLAESLVLAVSRRFDTQVSIRTLFEYPRVADFAEQVRASKPNVVAESISPPAAPAVEIPASSFQQRIWFAERVESGRAAYNVPLAWRVPGGGLDAAELSRALARMVARHELLRTAFHERDGELWQVVGEPWSPHVDSVDLRERADSEAALRDWLAEASHHEFDPASGRLLTAALVELPGAEQLVFLCLHHLLWDGESMGVLLRELNSSYRPTDAGSTVVVSAPPATDSGLPAVARAASAHQERMWFVDRFEAGHVYPTSPVYHNLPLFLRVDRLAAPDVLARALDAVVRAHESLRTVLDSVEGRIVQRVLSEVTISPRWLPAQPGVAGSGVPEALTDWAAAPFDLTSGCLLRVAVLPEQSGGGWLALVGHQAVVDRASLRLVAEQLLAGMAGQAPVQSSYAGWLDAVSAEVKAEHLESRAARLQPAVDVLRLPERRTREAIHVYEERRVAFSLPAALAANAERLGFSVSDVLLGAFTALLGWYSGQQDMVIGVSHPGRRAETRHVVGPLANLLPVRLRPAVSMPFTALVSQTAAETAHARAHDQAFFDELVRRVDPSKDMSRTALFDVLFTYAGEPRLIRAADGIVAEEVQTASGYGKYDLHLFLQPGSSSLDGWLVFNGRYFDDDQVRAMTEHYRALLDQLVAAPERAIGDADPLTEDERYTQLMVWNATDAGYPETAVHDLIRQRALARPQAVAITSGDISLTYRELLDRAEALARALVAKGVGRGELVALLLPRGPEQVQAMLAVLLAGAGYLPIDPALPRDRVQFILADSGTRWAIVADEAVPHPGLDGFAGQVMHPARADSSGAALPRVALDAPAYCIYTSGTTGRPKGVVITHRNLVRLLVNDRLPFSFGASDVWTMFHSYAFDFSVWELFGGLVHGGRVVLVSQEQAKDPEQFWELLQRERVTVLNQTPSAFRRLLGLKPQSPSSLSRLRYVIFGGEALRPAMLGSWMERYPHVRLVNMYGITETTVHSSIRTVTRADVDSDASIIGTPIPTTTLLLLDPVTRGRLLPVGAVGEIFVGGAGVAGGYLNRPELTAQRFVASPVGSGTLFRSGDLARYTPDGALHFIGRADSQVQLHGYRIELGEIESCLREHPAVVEAVVIAEDDRLVAVVQSRIGVALAELRGHLARKLPEYMIPSVFQLVDKMVLTSNGKLDVAAVRARAVPLDSGAGSAPRTPTAVAMAGIWSELLGVDGVSADDSFFALGGHSMLAVRLVNQLRRRFRIDLPMKTLFECPRLQDLADLIDQKIGGQPSAGHSGASSARAAGELAATAFQRRLWLAETVDEQARNNVVLAWKAAGGLDVELLGRALTQLVAGHELLRTAFVADDDTVRQVVTGGWRPEVETLDLRASRDPDADMARWLDEAASRRFDLASGRLLRAAVADLGAQGHALLLCLHHLVIDGESVPVLLAELDRYYRAVVTGETAAPPAVQYRDFVASQEARQDPARRENELDYWQRKLADAPANLAFPTPVPAGRDGAVRVPLPADLPDRLRPLQTQHGVTWFMAFGAALAVALHRWTGQHTVTLGVPVSTRNPASFAGLLGPCLNTLVLRSDLAAGAPLGDALQAMRTEMLGALEHAGAPFEEVVNRLAPARVAGHTPYIDVTLNMNLRSARRAMLGGIELSPLFFDSLWSHEAKFGLTLTVAEQDGELSAILSYQGQRVSAADAAALADNIARLLGEFTDGPRGRSSRGTTTSAADDRVQYRHFVTAQRSQRDSVQRRNDLAYWENKLAGAPAYVEFSPPAEPGPHGVAAIPLRADLLERLRPLQARYGVTPFIVTAAGLAALLHRWTGHADVVISNPIANRDNPDFAELLGPCLNTVVLRSQLASNATFLDVLHGMRSEVLEAFEHAGAPFEEVVERLNPHRRPGRTPYADVSLTFSAVPAQPASLAGRPLQAADISHAGAGYAGKLGLTVGFTLDGTKLSGNVAYHGARYRRDDVERFATMLGRLMELMPDHLDQPVAALDVAADELARLRRWERGPEPEPMTPVPALVLRHGRDRASAPAVESLRGTLDYQGLVGRARALAARIRPRLRGADPVVALLLPRGEDFTVAMLGSWLAGAAFCPIDPAWPDSRVRFVLDDLDAPVLLTDRDGAARSGSVPTLRVDEFDATAGGTGADDPNWSADSTAYVIYTSGTTGTPKGVVVTHRGLAQLIQWTARHYAISDRDRCSHLMSVGFDASQWEVWFALATGACLVPHEAPVVASTVGAWLDQHGINIAFLATPLAEALWRTGAGPTRLRWMFIGGAALSEWPPPGLPYRVCNAYGPTENSVVATTHDLESVPQPPINRIGRPIAGVRVLVLDPQGRRSLVGVPGEICLAGGGLATGILRRPDLTADRFRSVELDGESIRIYRTGDLGRWLADGTIEYLGRADRQLKIRGYRIEPGEIEQVLLRQPEVAQAVVHGDSQQTPALVAYVIPSQPGRTDTARLLARLRSSLPAYMVPEAVVWLTELPLNTSGKVDVARLPRPIRTDLVGRSGFTAPGSELERRIAAVWSEVLGTQDVGAHDNFFDLGGNSLSLARLHSRLVAELGRDIAIVDLFEHPTVAALATALENGEQLAPVRPRRVARPVRRGRGTTDGA